jgi:translation initiation factor 5
VLCKKCKNPETEVHVKDGLITLDCKACGEISNVDIRLKLSSFILKNQPKKGKKDKAAKKAERKARKEAHGGEDGSNGSHHDSNSDHAEEHGDFELDAGSDDELTRRINAEAKMIPAVEPKKDEWTVDVSEEAAKARAAELSEDLKHVLVINIDDDEDDGETSAYDQLGSWIIKTAEEKGGIEKVDNVDIYLKAKEFAIEGNYRTLTVLAQTIFSDNIVKEIPNRASMLKKVRFWFGVTSLTRQMITSERHEKALLGGTERFVGKEHQNLISKVTPILVQYYNADLITEEVAKAWASKASKKYVDIATSKKVRKSAGEFVKWLEEAEEEDSSDEE